MLSLMLVIALLALPAAPYTDEDDAGSSQGSMDVLFFQYRLIMRDLLSRNCVYSPSCSHYGQEAILESGPLLGTMMALERWTRCHSSSLRSGEYADGPGREVLDPVDRRVEVTCWGRSLLPF